MKKFITSLRRGDLLIWGGPDGSVYIFVTRVAKDSSWADLRMCTWAASWTKRMPMPIPAANWQFCYWDSMYLARDAEKFNV